MNNEIKKGYEAMYGLRIDIAPTSHLKYKQSIQLWKPAILEVLARTGRLPINREPYIVAFPQGKNPVHFLSFANLLILHRCFG